MLAYILAAAVFITVLTLSLFIGKSWINSGSSKRMSKVLSKIHEETDSTYYKTHVSEVSVFRQNALDDSEGFSRLLKKIPGFENLYDKSIKAGLKVSGERFFLYLVAFFAIILILCLQFGFGEISFIFALAGTLILPKMYLASKIKGRNDKFIEQFPDALDMIVRSVRSGHPLNAALRMIAENMPAPVGPEFRQVVDEIAYGRTMTEALYRLAGRVGEADINFFVVVLVVQQETGGNLSEVLSNLSNIIRKRKQLRLKIKAITSEARITAWILGSLPFLLLIVLHLLTPGYLDPLFEKDSGKILLAISISMVAACAMIVKKMINIDI